MVFENLGQHLGGYSQGMLQAAIAGREQALKEKNMQLQAPLQIAQTLTQGLGQWAQIDQGNKELEIAKSRAESSNTLDAANAAQIREETVSSVMGRPMMLELQRLIVEEKGSLRGLEARKLWQAIKQADLTNPETVALLKGQGTLLTEQSRELKIKNDYEASVAELREESEEVGLLADWQKLELLDGQEELQEAQIGKLKVETGLIKIQGEHAGERLKDAKAFRASTGVSDPDTLTRQIQALSSEDAFKALRDARTELRKRFDKDGSISATDVWEVIATNLTPELMGYLTTTVGKRETSMKSSAEVWDGMLDNSQSGATSRLNLQRQLIVGKPLVTGQPLDDALMELELDMVKWSNMALLKGAVIQSGIDKDVARAVYAFAEKNPTITGVYANNQASHPQHRRGLNAPGGVFVPQDVFDQALKDAMLAGAQHTPSVPLSTLSQLPAGVPSLGIPGPLGAKSPIPNPWLNSLPGITTAPDPLMALYGLGLPPSVVGP